MFESLTFNDYDRFGWQPASGTRRFTCGWCGRSIVSQIGLFRHDQWIDVNSLSFGAMNERVRDIRVCPDCGGATTFVKDEQYPRPLLGEAFNAHDKPVDVQLVVDLYNEARMALSQGASSCAVLMFRKLLMHIAVEQGAGSGLRFVEHVDYLKSQGIVGRPMHGLLDRIRTDGNQENHEIVRATRERAEDLLTLVSLLIRSVYFAG
ncbi:MAG: DUF4145 domain-containing protein [Planctomycetes bacterium]|nr:DUF4145 domain-containing protein [Planctomycetota bacterium]